MKIRTKIIITFVSIFIVVIAAIVSITLYNSDSYLTQQIRNNLTIASQLKADQITTYVTAQKQIVQLLAASQVFRDFLKDSSGSATFTFNKEQSQQRLNRSLPINKNYNEIFIVGKNGSVAISTDPAQVGQDKTTDDYFTEGEKGTYVKSIYVSPVTHKVSYALSSPILDDTTKNLLGVLVIRVNVEDILSLLSNQTELGSTGENFLINNDLYLITPSRYLDMSNVLTKKIDTQNARDCIADKTEREGVVQNYIDYRGVAIVGTHIYIPDAQWCLITKIDRSEIYEPVSLLATIILLLSGIGALIFVIAGYIFSRRITHPIAKLSRSVSTITKEGNLDEKVGTDSTDEIGELSRNFDLMTASIKQSRSDIDRKVAVQTQEIVAKGKDLEDQQKAIMNILEDVDAEKEKATLEKTRYESLLTSIGDGVIATDSETKIIVINTAAEKILGLNKNEAYGKRLIDVFTVVDQKGNPIPESERPINIAISQMKSFSTSTTSDYFYQRKDGSRVPVALNASPVIADGKLFGVIDVFRDISHEKEVDRMKTEFISLASHQLRTPLSAMKWFAEMLLAGDAGPLQGEQKEFVDNIYQSNERMIALVNSLLNISRIESGRIIIEPVPTDVGPLVRDVIKELQVQIDQKKMNMVVSIHESLPKITIDGRLIREVYKNLLTNAIKYTPAGGDITIFVSKNGENIVSQISDTGYGIPAGDKDKIFEKFYRGENIVKLETEGTGLGLYLAKAVVESSGGTIWFESTEGKGSSFWFSLPVAGSVPKQGDVTLNA